MSNIKKLLEGVDVEWKMLGEVCDINTGQKPPIIEDKPTNFDYINAGTSKSGYCKNSNCDGDTVTTPSRGQGGIGYVGYQFNPFWLGPLCYKLKSTDQSILINKFLFYFLQSEHQLILGLKKEGGVPAINKYDLTNILIPIPPFEIQKEIVRILDNFSSLTTELQAELQARKSQYEYYRNQLLTYPMEESDQPSLHSSQSATSIQNSDNPTQPLSTPNPQTGNSVLQPRDNKVKWKVLEEVVDIKRGRRLVKTQLEKTGKYAVYQNCMIPLGYYHKSNVIADTTFIISAGSAGEIGYSSVDFWAADDVYYFVTKNDLKSRFLYYFLLTQQQKIYSQVRRSSVPRLSKTVFEKLLIPIPALREQKRIIAILDKFDTLTTSITEGLPKEIELRQKQYEYYRDMLLTFPTDNIKV